MRIKIAELCRQQLNWSMKRLADHLDVEHQTVMNWNQGRAFPRLPMFIRLAGLLDCSLQDLIEMDAQGSIQMTEESHIDNAVLADRLDDTAGFMESDPTVRAPEIIALFRQAAQQKAGVGG